MIDRYVKMQFLAACLSISSTYESVPMSMEIPLKTLFPRIVKFITVGVTVDLLSAPHDCIVTTAVMAVKIGVNIGRLILCCNSMLNRLVCIPTYGISFVVGFRYQRTKLIKAGKGYEAKNWQKDMIDMKNLKQKMRLT